VISKIKRLHKRPIIPSGLLSLAVCETRIGGKIFTYFKSREFFGKTGKHHENPVGVSDLRNVSKLSFFFQILSKITNQTTTKLGLDI